MKAHSMDADIVINTGLPGFIMLDRVLEVNASRIVGTRIFSNVPAHLLLESLAQIGAFHIRYMTGYSRHVFLIKIVSCSIPLRIAMEGEYVLSGKLLGRTGLSFRSFVKAESDKETAAEAELLYAAVNYDHNFKEDVLRDHYIKVFSCLQKDF
ncbi:MAG TPA: hypothetical protein VFG29_01285 [Syntrophales bacterium]|nr:hypothetical protein [Syntrophales bacterium]